MTDKINLPKISVILPVYNSEGTIKAVLDSIQNQTYRGEFEVIAVNDGSTDGSAKILDNYKFLNPKIDLTVIHQTNKGVSEARNTAMKKSTGEWIALLDSDDLWDAEKTEKQMMYLTDKSLNIDLLGTLRNGNPLLWPYKTNENNLSEVTLSKLLIRNELQPSTVIFHRKIIENTGYFELTQSHAEDMDYWLRASLHNRLYVLCESLILAGKGKLSFGTSGLSADLKSMRNGFISNLKRLHKAGRISKIKMWFYSLFYRLKYLVLVLRITLRKKNS